MQGKQCFLLLILTAAVLAAEKDSKNEAETRTDLDASPTSAKLFNLGGLFGQNPQYPNYPYGYGSYVPNTNYRPPYSTTNGNYPNNYYPATNGWTGGNYYPGQGYYGNTGSYYPNTGSNYPSNGYYPTGTGTNILGGSGSGNGGYGGYGGNGGLRQYSGYWNPEYTGRRNRGYGYFPDTDRYGLPQNWRASNDQHSMADRERDRVPGSYRGYN